MMNFLKDIVKNEKVKTILKKSGVVAGAIVIEGIKGVAIKGATKAITTSFDSGIEGVKKLTVEDYVGRNKKIIDIPKVKSNKEKAKVEIDADFEVVKDEQN